MSTLKVTSEWLNWFHKEAIEVITTIDNREMFTKTFEGVIQGNHLNYSTVFRLTESVIKTYSFLIIENIRLAWSEKLEKDNLQSFKQGNNFKDWKENVVNGNYEFENSFSVDYEDSTDIYFNYEVDVNDKHLSLYKYGQTDFVAIYLWYNPKMNTTNYKVCLELRKALFMNDNNFDVQLPDKYREQNKILLEQFNNNFPQPWFVSHESTKLKK